MNKAVAITEEIKQQSIELYRQTVTEQNDFIRKYDISEELKEIPVTFFMPLNVAERAQSNWQKAQLFGFFSVDWNIDKFLFDGKNHNKERDMALTTLAADLNFHTDILLLDSLDKKSNEEAIKTINDYSSAYFIQSLEDDNTDLVVVSLAYSIVESSVCKIGIDKLLKEPQEMERVFACVISQKEMFRNFSQLYHTLLPFYDTLSPLKPIVEKIDKLINAKEEKKLNEALSEYVTYIYELRDHILTEFNLVVK